MRIAFASPPAPVVSWPTHPHKRGRLLVVEPGCLATDTDLKQDPVGPIERHVEVLCQLERSGIALTRQHPLRHPTHDLQAFGHRCHADEPVDRDALAFAHKPRDELRRVG